MYECWAWIDGDWVKGWDVGDTAGHIAFRRKAPVNGVVRIKEATLISYSKDKPNYTPKEVNNVE